MWALVDKMVNSKPATLWINLALISVAETKNIVKVYGYDNREDLDQTFRVSPKRKIDQTLYNIK